MASESATRLLPTPGKPGPVTAAIRPTPGETGSETLARVGGDIMPKKTPKGGAPSKVARQFAAILACRCEGMSDKQIAEALGLAVSTVRTILYKARKQQGFSDIVDRVENRAVPQAVDNLIEFLDEKDREFTKETLKGVGIFRSHSAQKVDASSETLNTLRVEFVMPDFGAAALPQTAVGSIVANSRKPLPVLEGETV